MWFDTPSLEAQMAETRGEALAALVEKWRNTAKRLMEYPSHSPLAQAFVDQCANELEAILNAPPATAERSDAPLVQFQGSQDEQTNAQVIANLAMLVRRLAHKHPNKKLKKQAHDYLLGEGLEGSVLRSDTSADPSAEPSAPGQDDLQRATAFQSRLTAEATMEEGKVWWASISFPATLAAEFAAVRASAPRLTPEEVRKADRSDDVHAWSHYTHMAERLNETLASKEAGDTPEKESHGSAKRCVVRYWRVRLND